MPTLMPANVDANAVADAIAAGELEAADVAAGSFQLPISEEMSGKLQIIIAVIDGEDVKTVATAPFEYYGAGGSGWKSLGVGFYTEDYIVSYYGTKDEEGNFIPYDPETYQVEIEANTKTPGLYRMKNAYAPLAAMFGLEGGDKDIEVNAEDPAGVYIMQQPTGFDAGSGESNIRRYVIENDLVDAIIQLPNNIFYNTGITTYIWILTNKKPEQRRGKVQLIDASQAFEKLRKNQGSRNCTITPDYQDMILKTYMDFVEQEGEKVSSKLFDNDDFRYYNVTIERPLRLRSQFNALKIDELLFDKSDLDMSKWLYETYHDRVFEGLDEEIPAIKEYLNDNEIKMTDKKIAKLINAKEWKARRELMQMAHSLMKAVGSDVYMDYNVFAEKIEKAAKQIAQKPSAAQLKTIARAMSETDPEAAPVVKKAHKANSKDIQELMDIFGVPEDRICDYGYSPDGKGYVEYEPDSDLRDTEKIPVKENIYEYFQREVRPYVADAWINLPPTKIGCEISFNKYFYKPAPLRSLEENERDIRELDKQSQGFIQSLFDLV